MIQPHSGSGKGFYFIPEIDEEVLVGFEGNNAQRPYVLGTQYNGSETTGYADGRNNVKAIHTRSGHVLKFTEEESIIITDKNGNEIVVDSVGGNISITANNTIDLNAKNINLNASQNITTDAGMSITETAEGDIFQSAGTMITQNAGADYTLSAANIFEEAKGEKKSKAKDLMEIGSSKSSTTEKETKFNTKSSMKSNSGDKSNFY